MIPKRQMPAGYKLMIVLLLLLATTLTLPALAEDSHSPVYLGYSPARPIGMPDTVRSIDFKLLPRDSLQAVVLHIDARGRIVHYSGVDPNDVARQRYLEHAFRDLSFRPARHNDTAAPSLLPVIVMFRRVYYAPEITFPVETDGSIPNSDLYEFCFRLNGIDIPRLRFFPSFHAALTPSDSVGSYPIFVARIEIDTSGSLTAVEPVLSTLPAFNAQLLSACLWADYEPGRIDGAAVTAGGYLVILVYPLEHYPAKPVDYAHADTSAGRYRVRVRIVADTSQLVAAPVQARAPGDSLRIIQVGMGSTFEGMARVRIDTLGNLEVLETYQASRKLDSLVAWTLNRVRFYPAISWQGKAISFESVVTYQYSYSEILRIQPQWWSCTAPRLFRYNPAR
jgi:hypothetical protein